MRFLAKTVLFFLKKKKLTHGTSLVAHWLRIRALVRENPTCLGATKPVSHNC